MERQSETGNFLESVETSVETKQDVFVVVFVVLQEQPEVVCSLAMANGQKLVLSAVQTVQGRTRFLPSNR